MKYRVLKKQAARKLSNIVEIIFNDNQEGDNYQEKLTRLPNKRWLSTTPESNTTGKVFSSLDVCEQMRGTLRFASRYNVNPDELYYELKLVNGTRQILAL